MQRFSKTNNLFNEAYRYISTKGEISLINLLSSPTPIAISMELHKDAPYEIYCISGYLFDDIERFATIEDAEICIRYLLL